MKCFVCGEGVLKKRMTQTEGEIKGETFIVNAMALACGECGHVALEGRDAAEYMRLLADAYRRAHGLLTSDEIRSLRRDLGMTQRQFACALGVGVASIKRWEVGMVQDPGSNAMILVFAARLRGPWKAYRFEMGIPEYAGRSAEGAGWEGLPHGPPSESFSGLLRVN